MTTTWTSDIPFPSDHAARPAPVASAPPAGVLSADAAAGPVPPLGAPVPGGGTSSPGLPGGVRRARDAGGPGPVRAAHHAAWPGQGLEALAAAMAEDRGPDSLEANLRRLMKDLGLWGYHPRRSEKSEKGWPDWVIVGSRIIHRELKTERGKVTDEQEAVGHRIAAAGGDWAVWRPRDLLSGRVAAELTAISRLGGGAP